MRTSEVGVQSSKLEILSFRSMPLRRLDPLRAGIEGGRASRDVCFPSRLGKDLISPGVPVLAQASEPQIFSVPVSVDGHPTALTHGGFRPIPDHAKECRILISRLFLPPFQCNCKVMQMQLQGPREEVPIFQCNET